MYLRHLIFLVYECCHIAVEDPGYSGWWGVPFGIIFAQNGMKMKKWTKSATALPRNFLEYKPLDIIKSLVSLTSDKMTIPERNISNI